MSIIWTIIIGFVAEIIAKFISPATTSRTVSS
ncbi:putative membrane protein YeaQ/YmgE (transglycosylase-associated protein family) [Bradyrhizobium japonicum]|nr:putative membrane protein YeaQ/YmgE (transglycosylase-associated protein family) [Bradyrhizobium japonicum]MCS3964443.1 putative membrane protein YeaQ/YmgE (transglycosylase-associated protein family) [Bradyrhizobium japonicum]MCS3996753.1 putative membrane protein YeaQ/YmgE (transglycosylase-associated protein family) [Bradyrhizobium japonicum]